MPFVPWGLFFLAVVLFEGASPFQLDRINDVNQWLTADLRSTAKSSSTPRSTFIFETVAATTAALLTATIGESMKPSLAFEGGVGGLGKTKPETGVNFLEGSEPIQNAAGIVSAEILLEGANGGGPRPRRPVRVEFTAPWPLLPGSAGLEARDLQASESAFVQVVDGPPSAALVPASSSAAKDLFLRTVFSSQGKFSAYGSPMDVKVRKIGGADGEDPNAPLLYAVSFTTLTPGLRESERQAVISCRRVGTSLVMLVVGTTAQRFKAQQPLIERVASSLQAFETPELTRRS